MLITGNPSETEGNLITLWSCLSPFGLNRLQMKWLSCTSNAFSLSWKLDSWVLAECWFWGEPSSGQQTAADVSLHFHVAPSKAAEQAQAWGQSPYSGGLRTWTSSNPNYQPKTPSPNAISLRERFHISMREGYKHLIYIKSQTDTTL